MKKLILTAFALTTAASVFAQGTVVFANRFTTGTPNTTHVYAPLSPTDTIGIIGLAANDVPVGSTDFGGRALIGAGGATGQYGYQTTFAQLIGAPGQNQADASLLPVGQTTTFRSGSGIGLIAQITSTLSGAVPIPSQAEFATFKIVAWDNSTGLYPTWTEALAAWEAGDIAAGMSAKFTLAGIGGGLTTPPNLNASGANLTSFNLYFIPEPSTFALAGLGAAALLILRRRK